jgi:hypothetical protein
VEECFCLVEGRDPPSAAHVWGQILREREEVDEEVATAMLARLVPRLERINREYASIVGTCKILKQLKEDQVFVPISAADKRLAIRDVMRVLDKFPGIASLWWWAYRLYEASGKLSEAWDALSRAMQIDSENSRFKAESLHVAGRALSLEHASQYIAGFRASLDKADAEECIMYAFAEIELAKNDHAPERWTRARDATRMGMPRARSDEMRKNLHAMYIILDSLISGREPTIDVLYRVGLGEMAAGLSSKTSVIDLVAKNASTRLRTLEMLDAA